MKHKQILNFVMFTAIVVMATCSHAEPASVAQLTRFKQISEGLNKFAPYKVSVNLFYNENGKFPSSNNQLHIPAAEKFRDEIIDRLTIEGEGIIAVNYVNFPEVANAWIHLVPDVTEAHSIHWRCISNIPDIEKTAPDCHFYRTSPESETRILQEAKVQELKKPDLKAPVKTTSAKELNCEALRQSIENKLLSNGVKNYHLTILGSADSSSGKIVGRCNRGMNKIGYQKLPTPHAGQ